MLGDQRLDGRLVGGVESRGDEPVVTGRGRCPFCSRVVVVSDDDMLEEWSPGCYERRGGTYAPGAQDQGSHAGTIR